MPQPTKKYYGSSFSTRRQQPRRSYSQRKTNDRRYKKDYIDPRKFVKVAKITQTETYSPEHSFNDFNVNHLIKQNLLNKGFISPSPIQDKTIAPIIDGKDVIGLADTGTGKTAAFAIPLLDKIMLKNVRLLVIAPTRELAQQIDEEFRWIAKGSNLNSAILIGGTNIGGQLRDLRRQPQIVIGTPGRIKDHFERGSLNLASFSLVVLDEVDRMLDMGFINDVKAILNQLSPVRQSLFFSATLAQPIKDLINGFSKDPFTVSTKSGETSENVHQDVVYVNGGYDKLDKLNGLLKSGEIKKAIIFDDTQRQVEKLSLDLSGLGFRVDAIHGGRSQGQRQRSLAKFKRNEVDILVATDVAARGIDVVDITHVINYSTPNSYSDYIHRIGRAGRAGKIGYALTFVDKARA